MSVFNTITGTLEKGAQASGISLKSIASGFGLVNNTQTASNYDVPLKSTTLTPENVQAQIDARKKVITDTNELRYPPDISRRFMRFDFYEYDRPNPLVEKELKGVRQTIILPIPSHNLAENYDPIITGQNLDLFGTAINQIEATELGDVPAIGVAAGAAYGAGSLLRGGSAVSGAIKAAVEVLSPVAGNLADYGQQKLGAILNPHPSYFFKGVNTRYHTFSWQFAPRNRDESATIQSIVKGFKNNMLPSTMFGTAQFLTYPSMCKIRVFPSEFAYEFKLSFVDSLRATYSPQTFAGTNGAPAFVNLTVIFQEIEVVMAEKKYDTAAELKGREIKESITSTVTSAISKAKEGLDNLLQKF